MTVAHGYETDVKAHRPVIQGRRLVVSCGHYLASQAGMSMLALGGNAVDAGVAMVFCQMVLEFGAAGFGGECPILIYSAREGRVVCINGNTNAPMAATIEKYRELGVTDPIPGDGFLAAGVCATPAALITALDRYGCLSLEQVLAPAIELAGGGFPMYDQYRRYIVSLQDRFRSEWPSSAALFLPGDQIPELGDTFRHTDLARTYEKLVEAERGARSSGRSAALRAALDRFYRGDIARDIVAFQRETTTKDASGIVAHGLLTEADFARYEARVQAPVSTDYRGYTVYKCPPWSQGPVFLQSLNLLEGFDLAAMGAGSAEAIHTVVEAMKLAFADREQYYGDPDLVRVPLRGLLSKQYAAARRALIDPLRASAEHRPGDPYPYEGGDGAPGAPVDARPWAGGTTGTRAVDAEGNLFSATPSGGWFRSSPVIPGVGICLGTRLQMFWLQPGHPSALAPGKQPRTTLTPSLVRKDGVPLMAFGTPGGDGQDQWTLQFFLNLVDWGMDPQDAIDFPLWESKHFPDSFYPRVAQPGLLAMEGSFPAAVRAALAERGHRIDVGAPMSLGNTTAVFFDAARGRLSGVATARGQKAYALGW